MNQFIKGQRRWQEETMTPAYHIEKTISQLLFQNSKIINNLALEMFVFAFGFFGITSIILVFINATIWVEFYTLFSIALIGFLMIYRIWSFKKKQTKYYRLIEQNLKTLYVIQNKLYSNKSHKDNPDLRKTRLEYSFFLMDKTNEFCTVGIPNEEDENGLYLCVERTKHLMKQIRIYH